MQAIVYVPEENFEKLMKGGLVFAYPYRKSTYDLEIHVNLVEDFIMSSIVIDDAYEIKLRKKT